MIDALFLNPMTKAQLKSGRRKHNIRSKTLKGWQAVVKKHGGDMKAAAKEWKSRSRAAVSRRRGAVGRGKRISVQGLSGLAARRAASSSNGAKGGVPMAARRRRRRRRNQLPPTAAWIQKWQTGMKARLGKMPAGPKFKRISADARVGQKQWKGRYKRRIGYAMAAHKRTRAAGAKRFATRTMRGVRMSPLLAANPMYPAMISRRWSLGTGFPSPWRPKRTKRGRFSRRRRGPQPGSQAWARKVVQGAKGRGQQRYARGVTKAGLPEKWRKGIVGAMKEAFPRLKANPRRGRRKGMKSMRRRYPIMRAAHARSLMLNLTPRRRKRRKGARKLSRRSRMMNPVSDSLKAMITQPSLMTYAYVSGGVAVGGVFPKLVSRYLWKTATAKSAMTEAALGVVGSALAGLGVAMATKNDQNGVLVAAGGLAGVVGNFLISTLNKALGFSGLGQAAEDALKAAVEQEMARAGLTGGVGQFLLPGQAESLPGTSGMGQFLTEPELQMDVAQTEGLGQSMDLEATGSAAFDGSVF